MFVLRSIDRSLPVLLATLIMLLAWLVVPDPVVGKSQYVDETVHSPGKVITMNNLDVELLSVQKTRDSLTFMQKRRSDNNAAFLVTLLSKVNASNGAYPLGSVHLIGPNGEQRMKSKSERISLVGTPTKLYEGELHRKVYKIVTKSPNQYSKIRVSAPELWGDSDNIRYFDVSQKFNGSPTLKQSLASKAHSPGYSYNGDKFSVTVHGLKNRKVKKINENRYKVTYEVEATIKNLTDSSKNANVQENLFLQHPSGIFSKPSPNLTEEGYLGQIETIPANSSKQGLLEYPFTLNTRADKSDLLLRFTRFSYTQQNPVYWTIPVSE